MFRCAPHPYLASTFGKKDEFIRRATDLLRLPTQEKIDFIPSALTAPTDFDLPSGHLRTTYRLEFLIALAADVFSTETYLPPDLKENRYDDFDQLVALMNLMLMCRDERHWDPRKMEDHFSWHLWGLLQVQADRVDVIPRAPAGGPRVSYEDLERDWAGEQRPEPGEGCNGITRRC